jgi:hypothetical protein
MAQERWTWQMPRNCGRAFRAAGIDRRIHGHRCVGTYRTWRRNSI